MTIDTTALSGPYQGSEESIVIAIDVGTTYSGVSYARLLPGYVPKVEGVMRFPGHTRGSGDAKIPSVIFYDDKGNLKAAGAEAQLDSVIDDAEANGWVKVKHFKLHIKPRDVSLKTNGFVIDELPQFKSPMEVFGDFLRYLLEATIKYINESYPDPRRHSQWDKVKNTAVFIITHPNGWEGAQQQTIRKSAVHGGLIPDTTEGQARLVLLAEGEASLHGCLSLQNETTHTAFEEGDAFIVADGGGGTLDINTYTVISTKPLRVQEIIEPDCRFAGGDFVNMKAEAWLQKKLESSEYGELGSLREIAFDAFTRVKHLFFDSSQISWLTIAGRRDNNSRLGVKAGKLKIPGETMQEFFAFSLEHFLDSIRRQKKVSQRPKIDVWLVGGFAGSPWVYEQLKQRLGIEDSILYRPDKNVSKAVADGVISYYLDRLVTARIARLSTGVIYYDTYNPEDPDHTNDSRKQSLVSTDVGGSYSIGPKFRCFITKGSQVTETTCITHSFYHLLESPDDAESLTVDIAAYHGNSPVPDWIYEKPDQFRTLCSVQSDLRHLCQGPFVSVIEGKRYQYWKVCFEVEFLLGLTEYQARLKWIENDATKYSPAKIIYDD